MPDEFREIIFGRRLIRRSRTVFMERIESGEFDETAIRATLVIARRLRIPRSGNGLDRFRGIGYRPAHLPKVAGGLSFECVERQVSWRM